jgi:hypothetical protein
VTELRAATYAGHTVDMLRKTYTHFREVDAEPGFHLYSEHIEPAATAAPTRDELVTKRRAG